MNDAIHVALPLLAILAGILLNRSDTKKLRAEMRTEIGSLRGEIRSEVSGLRTEMNARFDRVDAEFRYLHKTLGQAGSTYRGA